MLTNQVPIPYEFIHSIGIFIIIKNSIRVCQVNDKLVNLIHDGHWSISAENR